jgi:glycosyltransferase involved in cell wall biosynthesis
MDIGKEGRSGLQTSPPNQPATDQPATLGRPIRVAYLVSHPIQYQAPLLRRIAAHPLIDLAVFFRSDVSLRKHLDPGLGRMIEWDVPLVDGYRHAFLPAIGGTDRVSFYRPVNFGIFSALQSGEFDVLWMHGYAIWFNWIALISARLLGMKTLVRDEMTAISKQRSPIKAALKWLFFRLYDRLVDGYLAIGSLNRDYYRPVDISPHKVLPMGYCVDNEHFDAAARAAQPDRDALRKSLGLEPDRPILLYMSKLARRKRADDLLEAFAALPAPSDPSAAPYLLFAGSGEIEDELRARATEIDSDAIRFLGFRNQGELPALYDLADLFVLPAENEPWGLVVNEAMSAGCPVAASEHVASAIDLVRHGENGYLFPVGDRAALTALLVEALGARARLAARGDAARQTMDGWSFKQNVEDLLAALRHVTPAKFAARTEPTD